MSSYMSYRKCFVASCKNTNYNSKKLFIAVPSNKAIRNNWFLAVPTRKNLSSNSHGIYCCEDHFNMEQDCENWIKFKLMKCLIRMKKDVVPHRNLFGEEPPHQEQFQQCPCQKQKMEFQKLNLQAISETTYSHIPQNHKAVQVHIKSVFKHKGIQVKKKTRSCGINTDISDDIIYFK